MSFSYHPNVTAGFANATGLQEFMGASPLIRIYAGVKPANAATALSGNTQLAELVCAATPIASVTDTGTASRANFAAIADDTSADNTGTATFWRCYKSDGTTVVCQGDAGIAGSGASMILNTTSITAASDVSISSGYIDHPYGP